MQTPMDRRFDRSIWPNPARDVLMVTPDEVVPNQKIELTLMQADRKLHQAQNLLPAYKGQQVRIDVRNSSDGMYLLQVKQNGLSVTKHCIVI
jgi:hypothetical protein